jgi:hypothetical protein
VELEHYGNAEIDGQDTLSIANVQAGGTSITWEFIEDWFAPAQYFDLGEDEKLSAPSFEMMKGGLRIGDDIAEDGKRADTIYDYKQILHDPEFVVSSFTLNYTHTPDAASLGRLQAQMETRIDTRRAAINGSVTPTYQQNSAQYVIVDREILQSAPGVPAEVMTFAEASQFVHSRQAAGLIVVTSSERQP